MQLIEDLERHKSTCTLALAENGLAGIHTVLEQTKFTNKCLANIRAKQEKLLEINITNEQGVYNLQNNVPFISYILNPAHSLGLV
jgi:cytoskeletal protein RodZ